MSEHQKVTCPNRCLMLSKYHHSLNCEANSLFNYHYRLNGNLEYINPKFTEFTGYTSEEAISKNPRILKPGDLSDEFLWNCGMWNIVSSGKQWHESIIY